MSSDMQNDKSSSWPNAWTNELEKHTWWNTHISNYQKIQSVTACCIKKHVQQQLLKQHLKLQALFKFWSLSLKI